MTRSPLLLWLACMLIAAAALCSLPAHAQDDAALLLARVAVNEAGFDGHNDAVAIAAISTRNARGGDLATYLRGRFRRALAPAEARRNRPWIAGLSRSLEAPPHWPHASQPWSARRAQWASLLALMDDVVSGRVRAECSADTWGSPAYDHERIARIVARGGAIVRCGSTRNVFVRWP